jgi:hypothetical protein
MSEDYVPTGLAKYKRFAGHFAELVAKKAVLWGVTDPAKEKLTSGNAAWTAAQDEADNPETRTHIAVEKAHRLRKENTANIRWIVNTYINPNALGTITTEDRVDLGLHIRDTTPTSHQPPKSRPDLDVEPSAKFEHKVTALNPATNKRAKPADAYGVRYAWSLGGTAPASPEDLPKSKFSRKTQEIFSWDPSDQGKAVYYAAAYENSKGERGEWSAITSAVVP